MSFVSQNATPLLTREQIAKVVHGVSVKRGLSSTATIIALMTISTEVGTGSGSSRKWWNPANTQVPDSLALPHDSVSDDANSVGYFQQRLPWWGTVKQMMTLELAANTFLDRLTDDYELAAGNATLAGQYAQAVQGSAFPDRYAEKWQEAHDVFNRAISAVLVSDVGTVESPSAKPQFTEYPKWTNNCSSRYGVKPDLFLIHTQQGNGDAESLAAFLISTEGRPASKGGPVSYHYVVRQNDDGTVTVIDCVDTDLESWSVGNSNSRSINLCFAGSFAEWSDQQWMQQIKAIDVAAYLIAQDCKKYGIAAKVIAPPYNSPPPGVSDHRYCTKYLKDGNNHTDVGDNFLWPYLESRIAFYMNDIKPVPVPSKKPVVVGPADDQLNMKFNCLGGQTLVEAVAEIRDATTGSQDRNKTGVVMK